MTQETLFNALVRGLYAVSEENAEFIGQLCMTVPHKPEHETGVLAEFPANKA